MIEGESILCFAPEPWEHIWRNRHQVMSRLAKRNKVLFVEPRPYLRNVIGDARAGKLSWADFTAPSVAQIQDSLWSYRTPLYAPLSGRYPLNVVLRWLRERHLKATMRRLGFGQPILWLYRPYMADVVGRFDEKLVIYHIVDKYAAYEAEFEHVYDRARRSGVEQAEEALLRAADLVIVTSDSLWKEKRRHNPNTHWVSNAVDYEAFAGAALAPTPPDDAAALRQPIIGYVGAINEKLDYDLLREVALAYPDGSLMMVGPVDLRLDFSGLDKLRLPNVHFLGAKPVADVARYVACCQACLMPYKLNEWTAHINPLKLYEYLATGRPVISTAIPAVAGFQGEGDAGRLVRVAADGAAFVRLVGEALAEREGELPRQRMDLAAQNTWDARVEQLSGLIRATLDAKTRA